MINKVVLALSGGLDSSTLLAYLLSKGYECHCVHFTYGSKHNQYEIIAREKVIKYYEETRLIKNYHFDLTNVFSSVSSNLLKTGGEIPEGHYQQENMKLTVVPGRNLIFASILASIAESVEASHIALGVHAGDHAIYPDCRPLFISQLRNVLFASTNGKVDVMTPFLNNTKTEIVQIGYVLQVPFELTRTCYKDQPIACGKCGSCQERLEAFKLNNVNDPIRYE